MQMPARTAGGPSVDSLVVAGGAPDPVWLEGPQSAGEADGSDAVELQALDMATNTTHTAASFTMRAC